MLSENLRQFLQAIAWCLIFLGLVLVLISGLREVGLMSPPSITVNGDPISTILTLLSRAAAVVVQGGVLLVLLSIDERIQNRGA
ncbi:hypothetical protein JIP62_04615 [Brevundimonas vitis]|uniref:Uncharacterized protein n=1 Tax=Brevundimonas vitisensis TaxID=2800818 RepID=A0ABX7BP71_9CAUL|nr:hypothetical protein [Brevundimonas vitisensis]QQQ19388.1 hypothetical protein JIP62_04615 [Brevundimonas vitisensis]